MKSIIYVALAVVLAGCLGKMERITEDTKNSVDRSNRLIEETHNGQSFATAYAIVNGAALPAGVDLNTYEDVRAFSVETVIMLAKEERLGGYLGAPDADLRDPEAPTTFQGRLVKVPNVTYLRTTPANGVPALGVSPRDRSLHRIYYLGTRRAVWRYFLLSQRAATLSEEKKQEYRGHVTKLIEALTIVLGANDDQAAAGVLRGERARHFEHAEPERRAIATWLKDTIKNFDMNAETQQQFHRVVEGRLGFSLR